MQFRDVQRLIRIDVAQPREKRLIEEQWFELTFLLLKRGVQPLRRKFLAEGFRSEFAKHFFGIRRQPHAPEFAGVVEYQRLIAG